ncbi:hypothetical protein [Nostoc sp. C117]|uniref:hypothetical protein n=1 Tax=Nostoc sp. C117 TaxID=3349875 RepID=UPI00370D66D1
MVKKLKLDSHLTKVVFGFLGVGLSIVCISPKANATTYSTIDGYALNTNNQFRRFDSYPRMSQFQLNINDPDQQFDELSGSQGGKLLRNRSTGMCINIHYSLGQEFNTFPCNPNDPDQNIREIDGGGGTVILQVVSTGNCIDLPERNNAGRAHTWTCDIRNPNQRFYRNGKTIINIPNPQPTQSTLVRKEESDENVRYAAILASLRHGIKNVPGHSAFGVVKEWSRVSYGIYSNGERRRLSAEDKYELTTVSTPGPAIAYAVNVDNSWDRELVEINLKKRGRRKEGVSFRVLSISQETYTRFTPKSKGGYSNSYISAGCVVYDIFSSLGGTCNCTSLSVTLFYGATGEKYNLGWKNQWIPTILSQQIDRMNGLSDWIDPFAKRDID